MGKLAAYYEEAKRMFVQEGKTLSEISGELTDVSERTIQRWSSENDWPQKRKEFIVNEKKVADILKELQYKLAIAALDDPNPQKVYALCRVIAVLKPPAALELKRLEQEEKDAQKASPEEMEKKIREMIEDIYGIK